MVKKTEKQYIQTHTDGKFLQDIINHQPQVRFTQNMLCHAEIIFHHDFNVNCSSLSIAAKVTRQFGKKGNGMQRKGMGRKRHCLAPNFPVALTQLLPNSCTRQKKKCPKHSTFFHEIIKMLHRVLQHCAPFYPHFSSCGTYIIDITSLTDSQFCHQQHSKFTAAILFIRHPLTIVKGPNHGQS